MNDVIGPKDRRTVVTGVNGFVGAHLVAELRAHGHEVVGLGRDSEPVDGLGLARYEQTDLTAQWPDVGPVTGVVHLAGLSAVGPSFDRPQEYLDVNGSMIVRWADWVRTQRAPVRTVVVSSGAVYDSSVAGSLRETSPLAPSSPYVVSKMLVENLTEHFRRRGLDAVVARPFNHIGPGQGPGFLVPDLFAQLTSTAATGEALRVGDLSTTRDYTDVRDVVAAYRLLLEAPSVGSGVYNVSSGCTVSGHELLELLRTEVGSPAVTTQVDPSRIRPDDPHDIVGDSSRLRAELGWACTRSVAESVREFVAERAQVAR